MVKHKNNCNKVKKVYRNLEKNHGFTIGKTKNGVKVTHIESGKFYIFHYSEKGCNPLRRWIKKELNMNIDM